MTRAELESLGCSDAILASEFRKATGYVVEVSGDGPEVQGLRREMYEKVKTFWLQGPAASEKPA